MIGLIIAPPHLITDLPPIRYVNEQTYASSIWWPCCAEVVSSWLQASSFSSVLLLERSLGNKMPGGWGGGGGVRPSCP